MFLTYQYRLRPTRAQHRALERILEMQRLLYNAALEERISAYRRKDKRSIGWKDQSASLTEIRKDDPQGYGALPVALSRWTLVRLEQAMEAFFSRVKAKKGKAGFPRFRSQNRFRSFGLTEWRGGARLDGDRVLMKGLVGGLRLNLHRPLPDGAKVRSAIVTRDAKGWKVGLQVEVAAPEPQAEPFAVGLDLGVAALATLSTGEVVTNARVGDKAAKAVRKARRALGRCKRGSNRRKKVKRALARHLERVAAARTAHLHQAAADLTKRYGRIAVEDLSIRNMTRSAAGTIAEPGVRVAQKSGLNRSIQDAAWGRFVQFLAYKAERAGGEVVRVDPRKTSIACSACGSDVPKDLSVREHRCPACGFTTCRDVNAAINILKRGESLVAGRGGSVCPEVDKPLAGEARPGILMMDDAE